MNNPELPDKFELGLIVLVPREAGLRVEELICNVLGRAQSEVENYITHDPRFKGVEVE